LLGIVVSMAGVLIIILRGDLSALAGVEINKGDAMLFARCWCSASIRH
jgi:hypothetical protein